MIRNIKCSLVVKSVLEDTVYQSITKHDAGWDYLNFQARTLKREGSWEHNTGSNELLIVLLGGNFSVKSDSGAWRTINGRKNVFSGLPHALYLPPYTSFSLISESETLDIACGWSPSDKSLPASFITPSDVEKMGIEYRGGDNASRQINRILPPGSQAHRLICVEVYTPSGNWSSFPPHKHDKRTVDPLSGILLEAKLEEIYFYKVEKSKGFAIQKIYNEDRTLDEITEVHNNDVVLVPEGYHPVVAGHGYNIYYLNFLAGSDHSLASTDDPDHKWIYGTWKVLDPRIPVVTLEMNGE